MADRLEFQGKLGWILEEAKEHANRIQKEEIERYFENDDLSDEQMELVYDYLLSQKVAVSGYERKHGRVYAAEEKESILTQEEQTYLQNYERDSDASRRRTGKFSAIFGTCAGNCKRASRRKRLSGRSGSGRKCQPDACA